MPIQITISGDTAVEALRELHGLSSGLISPAPAPQTVAEEVPAGEEKTFPEPKKRAKAVKPAEAVVEPEPAAEAAEAPAADDQAFTPDDARKALADLLAQPDGKDKAKAIFTQFGAAKLSDIPQDGLKAFIAAVAKQRGL